MSVLADTNILLRLVQPEHAHSAIAVEALSKLRAAGEVVFVVPQNLYEFWVVATRPAAENGLGWTASQADSELTKLATIFPIQNDTAAILAQWRQLIVKHQVIGKSAHDARLVAAMIAHKLSKILSFNFHDFQRYDEITALSPETVVSARV
jgi:predicted nucleic acid-binding protein